MPSEQCVYLPWSWALNYILRRASSFLWCTVYSLLVICRIQMLVGQCSVISVINTYSSISALMTLLGKVIPQTLPCTARRVWGPDCNLVVSAPHVYPWCHVCDRMYQATPLRLDGPLIHCFSTLYKIHLNGWAILCWVLDIYSMVETDYIGLQEISDRTLYICCAFQEVDLCFIAYSVFLYC